MLEAMESVKRALSIDFKVEIARAARLRPDAARLGARTDNRPRFTTAVTVCRPGQLKPLPIARHIKTWWVPQ